MAANWWLSWARSWAMMHSDLWTRAEGKKKRSSMKSMEVSKDSKRSCTWHAGELVNQGRAWGRPRDNECLTEIQLAVENVVTQEMKLAILSWERMNTSTSDGVGANDC